MSKRTQKEQGEAGNSGTICTTLGALLEAADRATGGRRAETVELLERGPLARLLGGRRLRFV